MIKGKYTQVKDLRAGGSSQIVKVQNMVNQVYMEQNNKEI